MDSLPFCLDRLREVEASTLQGCSTTQCHPGDKEIRGFGVTLLNNNRTTCSRDGKKAETNELNHFPQTQNFMLPACQ